MGDVAYYVDQSSLNPGSTNASGYTSSSSSIIKIGGIRQITDPMSNSPVITCIANDQDGSLHSANKFILFSKDNTVNLNSVLGYYAEVTLYNKSKHDAELFSIGTETFESSK